MRSCIPEYTSVVAPLAELLEGVYGLAGRRSKRAASKISIEDAGWDERHEKAFKATKDALANAVFLAHPQSTKLLCLFTDASYR